MHDSRTGLRYWDDPTRQITAKFVYGPQNCPPKFGRRRARRCGEDGGPQRDYGTGTQGPKAAAGCRVPCLLSWMEPEGLFVAEKGSPSFASIHGSVFLLSPGGLLAIAEPLLVSRGEKRSSTFCTDLVEGPPRFLLFHPKEPPVP